jgi:RNA polymerase sigma factor (sigma-70 family)
MASSEVAQRRSAYGDASGAGRDVRATPGADGGVRDALGAGRAGRDAPGAGRVRLDPDSARWVRALESEGEVYEDACARLHALLLRIARSEIARRAGGHHVTGPELDDLAHQAAADALLAIVRKVGRFRGESKFTTWAFTFVVFEVSGKLGRHFWRTPGVAFDADDWDRLPDRLGPDPAAETEARELLDGLREAVADTLTEHQRRVFMALVMGGVPLDALVDRLGTNRNAVYKTMFDARRKLRDRLVERGHLDARASRPA